MKMANRQNIPVQYLIGAAILTAGETARGAVTPLRNAFKKNTNMKMNVVSGSAIRKDAVDSKSGKAGKFQKNGKTTIFDGRYKWYWDVRTWSPVIIAAFIGTAMIAGNKPAEVIYITEEATAIVEEMQMPEDAEAGTEGAVSMEDKAIALARLADSVAMNRSEEVKRIIMWVAINRTEDKANGYGKTLMEEIARPKQWQQYDPEAVYLESTYKIALDVLNTWQSGGARPIYSDMLWFILNGDGSITVRNQFSTAKNRAEATFGQ